MMNPALIHVWVVSGLGHVHDLGPVDNILSKMIAGSLVIVRKDMRELIQGMCLFAGKEFRLVSPIQGHLYRFHDKYEGAAISYPRYYCIGYIPDDFIEYEYHLELKSKEN